MNPTLHSGRRSPIKAAVHFLLVATMAVLSLATTDAQIIGFTEPYRKIDLSSDETGVITELLVEEGDQVDSGGVLAKLDDRVQNLHLEIATKVASATSKLDGAKHAVEKRQAILDRLVQLQAKGHASDSEVIRAEMELAIAETKWLGTQEELSIRDLERQRAEVQLTRRSITSPFSGIVSKIYRRQGEFLSPVHPEVATIIQIDRLIARFNVPGSQISMLKTGSVFHLQRVNGETVPATVERVGVVTDAESGTVEVQLVIDNTKLRIRAGESMTLQIRADSASQLLETRRY